MNERITDEVRNAVRDLDVEVMSMQTGESRVLSIICAAYNTDLGVTTVRGGNYTYGDVLPFIGSIIGQYAALQNFGEDVATLMCGTVVGMRADCVSDESVITSADDAAAQPPAPGTALQWMEAATESFTERLAALEQTVYHVVGFQCEIPGVTTENEIVTSLSETYDSPVLEIMCGDLLWNTPEGKKMTGMDQQMACLKTLRGIAVSAYREVKAMMQLGGAL